MPSLGPASSSDSVPPSLPEIVRDLRRLAVLTLDAGHAMAAAQIASAADRLQLHITATRADQIGRDGGSGAR